MNSYYHPMYPGQAVYPQAGMTAMGVPHMPQQGYPADAYAAPPGMGQAMNPQGTYPARQTPSVLGFTNDRFLKGLLIGAAAAYLLTNEDVQRTAIKGAVKLWSTVQGGVEEAKERFRDAEAEVHAARQGSD
ncbi:hypothetical protein F2Q65_03935 [Thiohalocapsa marina]|uniref:YtxH domain-containing protein n=1 Tax=Thiohalocapsa marina TaxID=424902 RepID=A0A5M8FTA5_9GAMM|nr:YtxH domain-containing protein [Thiohalocapsa marina]KAA6187042.1 hypothetical protein F2Q65_03935 [Thiohalocapsa marina]